MREWKHPRKQSSTTIGNQELGCKWVCTGSCINVISWGHAPERQLACAVWKIMKKRQMSMGWPDAIHTICFRLLHMDQRGPAVRLMLMNKANFEAQNKRIFEVSQGNFRDVEYLTVCILTRCLSRFWWWKIVQSGP